MTSDNSSLNYRLLVHFIEGCHGAMLHRHAVNHPDPTTQHSLTPSAGGYGESVIGCRSSMLTPTTPRSFGCIARILDALAFICVNAPHRQSYATGLQIDSKSEKVILTISTNTPLGSHEALYTYIKKLWGILRGIASNTLDENELLDQLPEVVFGRTLPKIQHRLNRFRFGFQEWVSILQNCIDEIQPPFDEPRIRQFGVQLAELVREIVRAVNVLPHISRDEPVYSEVQKIVMVKVPGIIEEIRKVEKYSRLWRDVSVAIGQLEQNMGELAVYNNVAKVAAFSTHTNALISAAHSEEHRKLFSTYEFTLKIIPSVPLLPYTFPSPPTDQAAAQALVDKVLQTGDPENRWNLTRPFIKHHVRLAPKDDQSKVVVYSELGLLVHYLKIIVAIAQGKDELVLPMNYIGSSTLQCAFCRTIFRVLEESVFRHRIWVNYGGVRKPLTLRFYTRGAGSRFPRNWGWPKDLAELVQGILVYQSQNSDVENLSHAEQVGGSKSVKSESGSGGSTTSEADWRVRVPSLSIDPSSVTEVEEMVKGLFTTKLAELLC
ncbi:hypothetical protein BDN72DRAFT_838383, partial [Pluteus cervinus]